MIKILLLSITTLFVFTACAHQKEMVEKKPVYYKVTPKLSHSFYN